MSQMYVRKGTPSFSPIPLKSLTNCLQHHYAKGSAQRAGLESTIKALKKKGTVEVPIVVGGKEVRLTVTP